MTPAFGLSAKYVIHTVGPIWLDGLHGEAEVLRACYMNSLALAEEQGCESIAFPLISAGNYGFPKDLALQTAISAISEFLMKSEMMVHLVVFDRKAYQLSENLFTDVKSYIDENLIEEVYASEYRFDEIWNEERREGYSRFEEEIYSPADSPEMEDAVCSAVNVKETSLEDLVNRPYETL